ncbi:MAG TPA: glycosyltransferase family 4 protein [Acidimicrobiales bacterium]|nr:glycosyltransferase family 4 protein [Acidimicrobiales bacterium]
MISAVHQFIPTLAARSAVGNHTLAVRSLLEDLGVESRIYVAEATPEVAHLTRPFRSYDGAGDEPAVLVYQASTGSAVVEHLLACPQPKVVNYHNMTPVSLFGPWEPHVGAELALGRRQLADLAPAAVLGIADSAYNRAELDDLGYADTEVVPLLIDLAAFDTAVDRTALARLREASGSGSVWLFVGRISPNKAQHDLIKAFSVYRRVYDQAARLRLVGGSSSHAYATALERFRHELELDGAVDLVGEVTDAELAAHYQAADVFVCASDHEGFCIPLLEAMHHHLPIVAYASAAVPETLAGAGLSLASKAPSLVAAAVHRVVTDTELAAGLVAAGRRRLGDFELARSRERFAAALAPVVDGAW